MGVALVTKRIVSTDEKEQGNAVLAFPFVVNSRLTSCTLLTDGA